LVESSVGIEEGGTWDRSVEIVYVCNLLNAWGEVDINGDVPLRAPEWRSFAVGWL